MPGKVTALRAIRDYLEEGPHGRPTPLMEIRSLRLSITEEEWMSYVQCAAEALGVEVDLPSPIMSGGRMAPTENEEPRKNPIRLDPLVLSMGPSSFDIKSFLKFIRESWALGSGGAPKV